VSVSSLRATPEPLRTALVTGASGYVGAMSVAALLAEGAPRVVIPVRARHTREQVLHTLRLELAAEGLGELDLEARVCVVPWSALEDGSVRAALGPEPFDLVHCAGSVSYFATEELEQANIALTEQLLAFARAAGAARFVYMSTAFACGYVDTPAPEALLDEPEGDPTHYTRSKRRAERLVAASGLPYLILRPSVLIGDSRDGRYAGKRYGLYQLWMGSEKYLTKKYFPVCHAVAPKARVVFVHQDAYKRAFIAALRRLNDGSVMHIVSQSGSTPTMREAQEMWFERTMRPQEVHYYPHVDDVPAYKLDARQRALLALASVNLQIASRHWSFAAPTLAALESEGLAFPHVTLDSLRVCQERFVRSSERLRDYHATYAHLMPAKSRGIDVVPAAVAEAAHV
jgi:nucleoside-diphosphate-sugar epimerase